MDELVILDFETTGLSPNYARVIEVGAIIISGEKIVDKLSQLMYPGCSIPYFITDITGITNQMVKGQPSPEKFMPTLKKF
ncbi:MAG TPA: 3'-5' exonuclease, partial [Gammaproteobacteria bacterium]|nr:3'-5' exonuclease [Gammaproteobacteria bacterium]